jgi:putative phage-type endonuclease
MIYINVEQGSEAWFNLRCGRITGTSFKDVMAGDSTATYKDLITDIAGEILSGEIEETYSNAVMERGKELEPEARKAYENIFDINVKQIGFITPAEDDEFFDWIGISPDGVINDGAIDIGMIEIKCPLIKTHLNYIEKDVFPNDYKWQVQGQLMVTDFDWCDFMSYYPGLKPFIVRVYPDLDMHEQLKLEIRKSIELIKKKIDNYNRYNYIK